MIKWWVINYKLCQLVVDFYGDQELMSYWMICCSGMMYWLIEWVQECFGVVRGFLVDQCNVLIDELMVIWDFIVVVINGWVII